MDVILVLFSLRTGHNRMNNRMNSRMNSRMTQQDGRPHSVCKAQDRPYADRSPCDRHSPNDRPTPAAGLSCLHDVIGQEAWPEDTPITGGGWRPCHTAPMAGQHLLQDCPHSPRCHQAGITARGHSSEGQAVWRPCHTAPMTGQHLLQDCPLYDVIR